MISVIKNVQVYSPKYLGKKSVVIVGDKIEGIYDNIEIPKEFININEIEGEGNLLFPGFIDSHVHIIGGGGEGGFSTRTPEIKLSELVKGGITTVIGCLGTDGICRDARTLIAKTKSLNEQGISAFCYTGSYDIPVKTVTGCIKEDLMLINEIIGVGEVAISDSRSSQASYLEFSRLVADARVGGLLSGKAGIVNIHIGDGIKKLNMLFELIKNTEIPAGQLLPTHINRTLDLFEMGIEYIKQGGIIDFTTSSDLEFELDGELSASSALKRIVDCGLKVEQVTFSSDGNGSMPRFNENGQVIGLKICSVKTLYNEVREAILKEKIPIEIAIKVITSNISDILKLKEKGYIKKGYDADLVIVDKENLLIKDVYAKGRQLLKNGEYIAKEIFDCD